MTPLNWSDNAKKAFALFATLNWLFGLWPLLDVNLRLNIRLAIGIAQVILMMLASLYKMFENCGNPEDSIDNLLVMASGVMNLSKLITYHVHRDKLRTNVLSAIRDWSSTDAIDYRDTMTSYERIYKRITFLVVTAIICCGTLYFLKVIVIDPDVMIEMKNNDDVSFNGTRLVLKRRYLFPTACTLNDVSQSFYLLLVFNQLVQLITCCIVTAGSDAFFLAITMHLCGQYEILKNRFASVGRNGNFSIAAMNRGKMANLITRHQHLMHLAELLEAAYNKIFLTQMLTSVGLISVAGFSFLIALKTSDFFGSAKSFGMMQYMLLQSLMYASIGEALRTQGDDVTQSIYDGSWYELPRYLSKDFVFVMMRSNVSPHLTVGKFCDMTRVTFMDIVKTSASYLSILRIMLN